MCYGTKSLMAITLIVLVTMSFSCGENEPVAAPGRWSSKDGEISFTVRPDGNSVENIEIETRVYVPSYAVPIDPFDPYGFRVQQSQPYSKTIRGPVSIEDQMFNVKKDEVKVYGAFPSYTTAHGEITVSIPARDFYWSNYVRWEAIPSQ